MADPVTVVITRRVLPGRERDFEAWLDRLRAATGAIPGYSGTVVIAEAAGIRHIVESFAGPESLKAWEDSPDRDVLIADANAFSTVDRQSMTGLETWFEVPGAPPRWKMAATTIVASYPVSYLVFRLPAPHETGLPDAVRALITVAILVPTLTWVLMPRLARLLARWLHG